VSLGKRGGGFASDQMVGGPYVAGL